MQISSPSKTPQNTTGTQWTDATTAATDGVTATNDYSFGTTDDDKSCISKYKKLSFCLFIHCFKVTASAYILIIIFFSPN